MTNQEIRSKLFSFADEKYKEFSSKLIPNEKFIIGVKMPYIRKLAKEIAKDDPMSYLKKPFTDYHEECLLYGLVIGYMKTDIRSRLKHVDKWLDCVDNWSVCDSSVMNMKTLGKDENSSLVWDFVVEKIKSDKPFIKRAMIVILFSYFNNDTYINKVLKIYQTTKDQNYYVKMALAWGLSVFAIKYFESIKKLLHDKELDSFVHNKTIQKCCESFRITPEHKQELKLFRL